VLRFCETRSGKRQSALRVWSSLIALVIASSTVLADSVFVKAGPRVRAAMGGMDCPRTSRKSRGSECRRPPGFAFLSVAPTTPPLAVDDRNGKVWIFLGCEGVFSATCVKAVRILCHLQVSPAPVTPTFTDVDPSRISPPGHRGARLFRPHGRLQPPAVLPDRQLPAPAWRSSWSKTPGPPIPEFGLLFVLVVLLSGRLRAAVLFANIGLKGKAAIRTLEPSCATISKGLPRTAEGFPRAGPRGGS
jgi:hypothetical protein